MSGIQKETVPVDPIPVGRIEVHKLGKKYIYKIRTAHGSTGMTGLRFFRPWRPKGYGYCPQPLFITSLLINVFLTYK